MVIMETVELIKNYSKCPLKKRPVLIKEEESEEQCEPENLSTKPEDLSKSAKYPSCKSREQSPDSSDRAVPIHVPKPIFPGRCDIKVKEEHPIHHLPYPELPDQSIKVWPSPLTPPMYFSVPNENLDPSYLQHGFATRYEENLFKTQVPLYNPYTTPSMDARTNYNNNIIKSEPYTSPRLFTPYRIDHHRPAFGIYPPSPASSQTSCNSYDSTRRSVSPVSTTSSQSEKHSSNYSIFRDVSALSVESSKTSTEKNSKSSHYQCPDCSKSYSTYSGLSKHLQFHCPAVEGNQAKKIFSCKNCDKVYTSLGALKMHIRTHTLPCKCDICGKAFSRPWLLQGHIRTHTGEKPFSCQHCHRAFADRSNLRAHLQTHSDVKKYSCTTCSKTFSRMSLLTKHLEVGCPGIQINHNLGLNLNQIVPTKTDISVY